MLNTILSDIYKNKKNKIFYICALFAVLFSLWHAFRYVYMAEPPESFESWMYSAITLSSIVLSVTSGFVITFFVQKEYDDRTIINILSAPTHRISFVMSKLIIWFLWFLIVSLICISLHLVGAKVIFGPAFGQQELMLLINRVSITYLLSFIASAPLLLITIIQRNVFYPSLMCTLLMTAFQMFTYVMPVKYSCIIPWSASMLYGMGLGNEYLFKALIPVSISGLVGILGACLVFRKQDL